MAVEIVKPKSHVVTTPVYDVFPHIQSYARNNQTSTFDLHSITGAVLIFITKKGQWTISAVHTFTKMC